MRIFIPILLILGACNGSIEETETTSGTTTTSSITTTETTPTGTTTTKSTTTVTSTTPCDATVVASNPSDGSVDVPVNSALTIIFNDEVFAGEWSMDVDGVDGSATLSVDGMSATFMADANYADSTGYTANWSVCQTSGLFDFTTGGETNGAELPGNTYLIDYNDVEWVEPDGLEDLLGGNVDLEHILVMVTDYNEATNALGIVGALGEDVGFGMEQAACYSPMLFSDVDFTDNPTFSAGPSTLSMDLGGVEANLEDLYIEATFSTDAQLLNNVAITGYIDTRPLDSLGYGDVSVLLSLLGMTVVPCADGATECLYAHLAVAEAGLVGTDLIDPTYDPLLDASCL